MAPILRHLQPSGLAPARGYSHGVEAHGGRSVFVAGQVALDPAGQLVGPGDVAAQAEQVFANLQAVLEAAGAGFDDVVKLGFFLLDLADFDAVRAVRDRFIDTERPPASTAVAVAGLVRPDFLIEVDAIAILA